MLTARTSVSLISILALALVTACAMQPGSETVTGYKPVQSWPITESVAAAALAPDGSFALLSYKGATGADALTVHRFGFEGGAPSKINISRSEDGIMFRAVAEAKAIAIAADGESFLANWPAYLAQINSQTGMIESVTSIADAGHGMTSFNVLKYSPDYMSAFGLGADLVRIDLSDNKLGYERDMPAPGGRSLTVLGADRVAVGNTESATVTRASADSPDCSIDGTITALASHPDGTKLVGALYDQENKSTAIVVWSAVDCSELARWAPGARSVYDLAWIGGGATIASAENDGELRFWQASTGELSNSMKIEDDAGFKMHFSEDGAHLLTHTMWGDKTLRFYGRL